MHYKKTRTVAAVSQSPSHGDFFERPCEKPAIVLRVMHRLEPFVGRSIHRTKGPLHSGRPLRTQWAFFVAKQLGEVSELGHGEAVLRWPRVRTITLVIDEGWEIGVDFSTDAVHHDPGSLGSQRRGLQLILVYMCQAHTTAMDTIKYTRYAHL